MYNFRYRTVVTEAELRGLFENSQKATSMQTALTEMGHSQPPKPVATKNIAVNSTMIFYWVRDRIRQNRFHIFWEEGEKKLTDNFTKNHPIWHQSVGGN